MSNYSPLSPEQRYQIDALIKAGLYQPQIARIVGAHQSIISREMRPNGGLPGSGPKQAHHLAQRQRLKNVRIRISPPTWSLVTRLLKDDWRPEQISGWLNSQHQISVSHESIDQFIVTDKQGSGNLDLHLGGQKQPRKGYGSTTDRGQLVDRVSIDQPPAMVDTGSRIGDWELDTIIGRGHKQALVSMTEPGSGLSLMAKVKPKNTALVSWSIQPLLEPISSRVFTLTSDNGQEFARPQEMATALQADFYLAHPYSSWQRGLNQNSNRLIGQYWPQKHDFTTITDQDVSMVMNKLNHRPRKCLGFKRPNQVFFSIKPSVALAD